MAEQPTTSYTAAAVAPTSSGLTTDELALVKCLNQKAMLIGFIIDVFLAGYRILTGRFYQNFGKIDQKVILPE